MKGQDHSHALPEKTMRPSRDGSDDVRARRRGVFNHSTEFPASSWVGRGPDIERRSWSYDLDFAHEPAVAYRRRRHPAQANFRGRNPKTSCHPKTNSPPG